MQIWDILSIAVLALTACIAGYFLLIFFNLQRMLFSTGEKIQPKDW